MSGRGFWLASALGGALALLLILRVLPGLASRSIQSDNVIISEVAWSGTAAGAYFEWIELHNHGQTAVDLTGWTLEDNSLLVTLSGEIGASEFLLLERNEYAVLDIPADFFLNGILNDEGESILLFDQHGNVVDSANHTGGPWPAGNGAAQYFSMERAHPLAGDEAGDWVSNDGVTRNGLDADGQPLNGTPGHSNSSWLLPAPPNLVLTKSGPARAAPGDTIRYVLTVSNTGGTVAAGVVLTDTLPGQATFVAHDGQFPLSQPSPGVLAWQLGQLATSASLSVQLSVTLEIGAHGIITNWAEVSTASTEPVQHDNVDAFGTRINSPESVVLIDAIYYDGYEYQDLDEAVRIINVGGAVQDLTGWRLSDGLSSTTFPQGVVLDPGDGIWIANKATSFRRQFGQNPDFEVKESDPLIPNLDGTWPGFSNAGDEVLLSSDIGVLQDVLVYEQGDTSRSGWSGPSVYPYTVRGVFSADGQILYRRLGPSAGTRSPDTNTAQDWAQFMGDIINGRRVRYPGWDLDQFYAVDWIEEPAELLIGITPDNGYELMRAEIVRAKTSIQIATHTFRSGALAKDLVAALKRGVEVTVLLEGGPVGGIDDAERHVCQQLELAGGQCWFMVDDADRDIHDRYRYLHAKYILIDDRRALISTENLSPDSLPNDDKSDGTWGRRGVILVTNAPEAVTHLRAIWASDFDPTNHVDLLRWNETDPIYGNPPPGTKPITQTGGISYSVRYPHPTIVRGDLAYAVIQSPENSLNDLTGILALLARAGAGDTILVEQLNEPPHWGASTSNSLDDPNPRLEALVDAARRGATVRLLLDDFFDDSQRANSNRATCEKVNAIASDEGLTLKCSLANPAGLGLHNKMILAKVDETGYVLVGSINGTELSSKGNREVALLIQSDEAYQLLADMFTHDWPNRQWYPLVFNDYQGVAQHLLISEVFYDPPGVDDAEFIELYNPTLLPVPLTGYALGDALSRTDFEDVRRFPDGAVLPARSTLIVATTATGFHRVFDFNPDFEILNTDQNVADLEDDKNWGDPAAILQLANGGDEVILRDPADFIVDALAYGAGNVPGNTSCALITKAGASLERYPPWHDTDDCSSDFREWPFPNPGVIP